MLICKNVVKVVSDRFGLVCLVGLLGLQVCLSYCVQQFWIQRLILVGFD